MKEKKALNQLIALLPMPAAVIDNKGVIEEANLVFKEKFNFNRSKNNIFKYKKLLTDGEASIIKKKLDKYLLK